MDISHDDDSHVSCVTWCCRQDLVCGLGVHSGLIMPPHWILKLPSRGRVQSSFRYSREWEEVTTTMSLKVHSKIRLA